MQYLNPIATVAASRVGAITNNSEAARNAANLLSDYAWSEMNTASRSSQWRCWLEFCAASHLSPIPATEGHFLAFVGWLKAERDAGRRKVGYKSLPQYFPAVRQVHAMTEGVALQSFPLLDHVTRVYRKWEEANFPAEAVRYGICATDVRRIWESGMRTSSKQDLRDAAAVVFAYYFNRLRERSVMSLQATKVWVKGTSLFARFHIWKGRSASNEQLLACHRLSGATSPMDILTKWKTTRPLYVHVRFFALPSEPVEWQPSSLTDCLT